MRSHCPDSTSSLCRDDNSSISFSAEVPIPGDGAALLCHCLQGRYPAPNNNCVRLSSSPPAILVIDFPEAAAFAPVNSGWKAAHIPQQQCCLQYNDRADCRIIILRWILILFQEVLHHLTHTRTSSFFFLQIYYARVTEFLRSQPSPLQRSMDAG